MAERGPLPLPDGHQWENDRPVFIIPEAIAVPFDAFFSPFSPAQIDRALAIVKKLRIRAETEGGFSNPEMTVDELRTEIEHHLLGAPYTEEEQAKADDRLRQWHKETDWIPVAETLMTLPTGQTLSISLQYVPEKSINMRAFHVPFDSGRIRTEYRKAIAGDERANEKLYRILNAPLAVVFNFPDETPNIYLGYMFQFMGGAKTSALGFIRTEPNGDIEAEGIYFPPLAFNEDPERLLLLPSSEIALNGTDLLLLSLSSKPLPDTPQDFLN